MLNQSTIVKLLYYNNNNNTSKSKCCLHYYCYFCSRTVHSTTITTTTTRTTTTKASNTINSSTSNNRQEHHQLLSLPIRRSYCNNYHLQLLTEEQSHYCGSGSSCCGDANRIIPTNNNMQTTWISGIVINTFLFFFPVLPTTVAYSSIYHKKQLKKASSLSFYPRISIIRQKKKYPLTIPTSTDISLHNNFFNTKLLSTPPTTTTPRLVLTATMDNDNNNNNNENNGTTPNGDMKAVISSSSSLDNKNNGTCISTTDTTSNTTLEPMIPNNYNKRANLPFSIMDKEIEQYAASKNKKRFIASDNNNNINSSSITDDTTITVSSSITTATTTSIVDDTSDNNTGNNNGCDPESNNEEEEQPKKEMTEYEKWVRRLYATNLFLPVKLGLQNMEQIHTALGNPMDNKIIIHIAGSNGKGSVTLKIAKALEVANSNLNVGYFVSPHIASFRERMQVNGQYITEEEVVQLLPPIYDICQKQDIPATFFEITTALAFSYYSKQNCHVICLETGLGGRLDATNIIKQPAISIITSIGLEHTKILGDTVEKIAMEKGGIIKENCPVLVGPNVPHAVLRQCATEKKASAYYTCDDVLGTDGKVSDDDAEDYDLENSRIAKAAIKILQQSSHGKMLGIENITDDIIEKGISQRPPCRFELITIPADNNNNEGKQRMLNVILDVAHNPPAMEYLGKKLHRTYPDKKFRIVVGMSADKDMKLCGQSLIKAVHHDVTRIHFVEAAHPRAAKLQAILNATGLTNTGVHYDITDPTVTKQLNKAKEMILQKALTRTDDNNDDDDYDDEILVVCGSVFLMAEAREALGINEPRDSDVISELAGAGVRHSQENFGNTIITK